MNAARRKAIRNIAETLESLRDQIEELSAENQEYYDNMPESLRGGDKGEAAQSAIEALGSARDSTDDAIRFLSEAVGD